MNLFKFLVAAVATSVIVTAFRDRETGAWLLPGRAAPEPADETEPTLGYDGMDVDTLLDWMYRAKLSNDALHRIERYESAHRRRGPVLNAVREMRSAP